MAEDIDKEISGKYCNRFGVIAVDKGFVTADQLKEALTEQADDNLFNRPHRLIGRIFFDKGWMTDKQIDIVLNELFKVILRPEKEFVLKDILSGIGYHGITSKDSAGLGESKKVVKQVYRGKVYEQRVDAIKRKELEFVVPDDKMEKVIETIRKVAVTEQGGDGRIYISTLDESIHIHTGDTHSGDSSEDE